VLDPERCLPEDLAEARLLGRVWTTGPEAGPCVVIVENDTVYDVTASTPTVAHFLAEQDPVSCWDALPRKTPVCQIDELLASSWAPDRDAQQPRLLAPCDLQSIKAAGVTFVSSLLERVVEERAGGDPSAAKRLRTELEQSLGTSLRTVIPGSPDAARLKDELQRRGIWSAYLEVGIGPDAEIFTKTEPLAAVGLGDRIGIRPDSDWNNPEPELVLVVSPAGRVIGATLGNDVNLRDFEGRSALLLGRAKDNNGSCAIGPFVRLLDDGFTAEALGRLDIAVQVLGEEGFEHSGSSSTSEMSRSIEELVHQAMGAHHQYPDGMMLFTGTAYAPVEDRIETGGGFTHRPGDIVTISCVRLGALVNQVAYTDRLPPWTFGVAALLDNLAARGHLGGDE
jgi:fumarylacetoacetate (FAA) hydrolase family protein